MLHMCSIYPLPVQRDTFGLAPPGRPKQIGFSENPIFPTLAEAGIDKNLAHRARAATRRAGRFWRVIEKPARRCPDPSRDFLGLGAGFFPLLPSSAAPPPVPPANPRRARPFFSNLPPPTRARGRAFHTTICGISGIIRGLGARDALSGRPCAVCSDAPPTRARGRAFHTTICGISGIIRGSGARDALSGRPCAVCSDAQAANAFKSASAWRAARAMREASVRPSAFFSASTAYARHAAASPILLANPFSPPDSKMGYFSLDPKSGSRYMAGVNFLGGDHVQNTG
jgi:hypothetical protein